METYELILAVIGAFYVSLQIMKIIEKLEK